MHAPRIAVVSARAARGQDEDESLLLAALAAQGAAPEVVAWDDPDVDWRAFALALLRSTWDYTQRLPEFLAWAERAAALTRLENPLPLLRWNTDKRYLTELAHALPGAVIPAWVIAPGADIGQALAGLPEEEAWVVKPAVGAGSQDVQRYSRGARQAITAHVERLHAAKRCVLVQPYLARVEQEGETGLVFIDGVFSHAVRKGPMLGPDGRPASGASALFAPEQITVRAPAAEELVLAQQVLAVLRDWPLPGAAASTPNGPPLYARVDLIRDAHGRPQLLELELCEPSLFLAYAPEAAARLATRLMARVAG